MKPYGESQPRWKIRKSSDPNYPWVVYENGELRGRFTTHGAALIYTGMLEEVRTVGHKPSHDKWVIACVAVFLVVLIALSAWAVVHNG